MRNEIFDICIADEFISKLFLFREVHSYGDNDTDATLASDTLACAVEHSVIIDVTLASMDKYAQPQAHKVIFRFSAHS